MTLNEWLLTLAAALNDDEPGHEFTRYKKKDLIAAYNAALCLAAKYREDKFTEYHIVKLTGGQYQDARGCCTKILDVVDQTDADGNTIKQIVGTRKTATTVRRVWNKASCLSSAQASEADKGYLVVTASVDRNMDGRFKVDPPVPCDVDAYVRVKCVSVPCPLTEADGNADVRNCDLLEAVWHYVLAKMMSGDRFATAAGGNAPYHYRLFFDILGVVQRQEDRLESEQEA